MKVVWTDHAIERARKRFGKHPETPIPHERLVSVGLCKQPGEAFKVFHRHKDKQVCFVCERREDSIAVLTVYRRNVRHEYMELTI